MKTLTLRVSNEDHAALSAAAAKERMHMASYLMRLFDNEQAHQPKPTAPKVGKREHALLEYELLMENLPDVWTQESFDRVRSTIHTLRQAGGNLSPADMPLPQSMVHWNNAALGFGGIEAYEGMSFEQLDVMVRDRYRQGVEPSDLLVTARNMARPPVPE